MDAALYHALYEEMQQESARLERRLEELRTAESFLLRRIQSARKRASYQIVLNDLASEISASEELLAELSHLCRFVSRALISAYSTQPTAAIPSESPPQPIEKPRPRQVLLPPLKEKRIEFDEQGFPIAAQGNGSSRSDPRKEPIVSEASPGEPPTLIFDPFGFPLNAPPEDSSGTILEAPPSGPPERPAPAPQK